MEWRFTSAVQNAFGGSKIRKMNRPSVIRARGHMVSLYPYRHMTRKPLKIKGFRVFFLPVFETVFNGKNGFKPERHPLE